MNQANSSNGYIHDDSIKLIDSNVMIISHSSTTYIKMQPIVTDRAVRSVGPSVTLVSPAKMAEPIEMPFGLRARIGCRNLVLDGVQITHGNGQF